MTNVIKKLRRNVLKLAILSSMFSAGHVVTSDGVAFIDDRTNYNFCRVGEASLLSANLTESEDVLCSDVFDNGMDTYVPTDEPALVSDTYPILLRVTYDMDDLKEVEKVDGNELLK